MALSTGQVNGEFMIDLFCFDQSFVNRVIKRKGLKEEIIYCNFIL